MCGTFLLAFVFVVSLRQSLCPRAGRVNWAAQASSKISLSRPNAFGDSPTTGHRINRANLAGKSSVRRAKGTNVTEVG